MNTNDGGPAFPAVKWRLGNVAPYPPQPTEQACGMSLRDWFAGMAMQSVLTWGDAPAMPVSKDGPMLHPDVVADWSYCYADAMLLARKGGAK